MEERQTSHIDDFGNSRRQSCSCSRQPGGSHPSSAQDDSTLHFPAHAGDEDGTPQPRFVDYRSNASSRWLTKVPSPVRRVCSAVVRWAKGPQPPQIQKIRPFLPRIQNAPLRMLHRYVPKRRHRLLLLVAFYFCWLLAFVTVVHHSAFLGEFEGYGNPTQISCGATYWADGNNCGLNGNGCRPFEKATFAFRCPGNCISRQVLNPHAVGTQEVIYRPLVVGGPKADGAGLPASNDPGIYRGDSFLCGAAIHAGAVRNHDGGCAVVKLIGKRASYPSTSRNSITSVGFDSSFPLSFSFVPGTDSECRDLRWPLLGLSVTFTTLLSLLTTSPSIFFYSIFVGIYFHVGLGSDPPNASGDYYTIVSLLLGRFLPAIFVAYVLHRYVIRRTLLPSPSRPAFPVEKTVLWLGACWVGALTNYTFDFIPIQRLTPHDLNQQPGAKAALAIIVLVLLALVLGQMYHLRLEGRLPRLLALYLAFGAVLGLFAAIPGLSLRIHHYILALLLLPGTSLQARPSLLYQGLLVGLFINGVARWGFESILQTPSALRGDGQTYSPLPELPPPVATANNITFAFPATLQVPVSAMANGNASSYDGISLLVNDVERYQYYAGYDEPRFTWQRQDGGLKYYFRFGYLRGSAVADYTKAGVWDETGAWREAEKGPSR